MFDVGFSELMVIALVALIVIGPERLPRVARTLGALLGRAQRYVNDVKADIQREVDLDELKNVKSTFQDAAASVEKSLHQVGQELHTAGESLQQSVAAAAQIEAAPAAETAPGLNDAAAAAAIHDAPRSNAVPAASAQMDLGLESNPGAAAPKV